MLSSLDRDGNRVFADTFVEEHGLGELKQNYHRKRYLDEHGYEFYCPVCMQQTSLSVGSDKNGMRPHFRHKSGSCIDTWNLHNTGSREFVTWYDEFLKNFSHDVREAVLTDHITGESHMVDVCIGNTVILIKSPFYDADEIKRRNEFLNKNGYRVCWIFPTIKNKVFSVIKNDDYSAKRELLWHYVPSATEMIPDPLSEMGRSISLCIVYNNKIFRVYDVSRKYSKPTFNHLIINEENYIEFSDDMNTDVLFPHEQENFAALYAGENSLAMNIHNCVSFKCPVDKTKKIFVDCKYCNNCRAIKKVFLLDENGEQTNETNITHYCNPSAENKNTSNSVAARIFNYTGIEDPKLSTKNGCYGDVYTSWKESFITEAIDANKDSKIYRTKRGAYDFKIDDTAYILFDKDYTQLDIYNTINNALKYSTKVVAVFKIQSLMDASYANFFNPYGTGGTKVLLPRNPFIEGLGKIEIIEDFNFSNFDVANDRVKICFSTSPIGVFKLLCKYDEIVDNQICAVISWCIGIDSLDKLFKPKDFLS